VYKETECLESIREREQWREARMFMTNVENSIIVTGKKSEHFQTFGSVTTKKCSIPLSVHIMVIVELVPVKRRR
jgi:hypothetical protein